MRKLSIIIPVFNEEETVEEIIKRVIATSVLDYEKEIIVVDDGSTDGTAREIEQLKNKIIFLRHRSNQGKGAAIRTALRHIKGDAVIIQDADLEYNPADIPALLKALKEPEVNVVYGSREIKPQGRGYPHYILGVKLLTALVNLRFGSRLSDVYTGYKLFRTNIIKSLELESKGFEFEMEVTVKLLKKGLAIKELPIHYQPRKFKEGKKIRFKDALVGLVTLIKYALL